MKALALLALIALPLAARDPLEKRIARTDPAQFRKIASVHKGAGELHYMGLFDASSLNTNLIFLHRGVIPPKGGIGHHFHNHMEEMFVIFDNEAEFTIDGRTSRLQGPAGAPCRMGHSHAIYNPTDKPTQWMNIAVGSIKGKYDAFDLDDSRVDVQKDAKPVFITLRLDKTLLKKSESHWGGKGAVMYRRALQPEVFYTNWSYVDHIVVPPGASIGKHRAMGVEEFWYVVKGDGNVRVNEESAAVKSGDAVPMLFGDVKSIENNGSADLELMIVGVARTKWALDTEAVK